MQISLYFHIPFCSAICHYCDFAKTANWDSKVSERYFEFLLKNTKIWAEWLKKNRISVPTVFFGGGTPGLFSHEYSPILEEIRTVLLPNAEISLEANPCNISDENLKVWKALGFNRLSLGVQSFQNTALASLNRDHTSEEAIQAIKSARRVFPNLNVDLIYGIPQQTTEDWSSDLDLALSLGINHLSLYNLTWEPGTVFGKRLQRGIAKRVGEEKDCQFYEIARALLAKENFQHEEVSNWSKESASCKHNWMYWEGGYYVGIGSGAHGYLPSHLPEGIRYSYPKNDRLLQRIQCEELSKIQNLDQLDEKSRVNADLDSVSDRFSKILEDSHLIVEKDRSTEDLFLETIGSSLRTKKGVPIARLESMMMKEFRICLALIELKNSGKMNFEDGYLIFDPETWFMENFWAQKVIECFQH